MTSVPKGYKHFWRYRGTWREQKLSPKSWKIDFKAIKSKKAKAYGNFKKGYKVHWKIKADQYAYKVGKGKYQTRLIGKKYLVRSKWKKKRR